MTNASTQPTVSIGLPVYNGEKYLANAIELLLQQTFTDFELIISDNASTDKTAKICQEYANRDRRIIYFRQLENIGVVANFEFVLQKAQGEYFMWAAHDDEWSENYIESLVNTLSKYPDVDIVYSNYIGIDAESNYLYSFEKELVLPILIPRYSYPKWFNASIFRLRANTVAFYGMYRKSLFQKRNPLIVELLNDVVTYSDTRFFVDILLKHNVAYVKGCEFKYRILKHTSEFYSSEEYKNKDKTIKSFSGVTPEKYILEPLVKYSPLLAFVVRILYSIMEFKRWFLWRLKKTK
ncbi:glycosyl transferase [Beggiatoa alba B18LD]|uniref:Glycosyl transferase n=1 Tax=Beggiatoa alba B18LD TaxID=395493 RepID=I3CHN6_9GAMM|nr:glycosyltransferase [Beggiatoa alba]EIJ43129.1 glycosyl transferase [Beggiatoa alba B18LD]